MAITLEHAKDLTRRGVGEIGVTARRRWMLVLTCALAAGSAYALGDARPALASDPDLAQLLRGMAIVKLLLVVPALALLWWRFGLPLVDRYAHGYLAAAGLMTTGLTLVWQLTWLLAASAAFHAGLFTLLILGAKDWRRA